MITLWISIGQNTRKVIVYSLNMKKTTYCYLWSGLGVLLVVSLLSNVNASGLQLEVLSVGGNGSTRYIQRSDAIDNVDSRDAPYIEAPSPAIDIYSKTSFDFPYNRFGTDSRFTNSTTNVLFEIEGRGLSAPVTASLKTTIGSVKVNGIWENNFSWKNLIIELYNAEDINNPANLLGVYDAQAMANGLVIFPTLQVNNGLSYQLVVRPRNWADFTLDNKVNLFDLSLLAQKWLLNDANPSNTWNLYTDIDRDGAIDPNDLAIFTEEWLFEGCNPNTFM